MNTYKKQRNNLKRCPTLTDELIKVSGNIRDKVKNKIIVLKNIRITVENAIKNNKPIPVFRNLMSLIYNEDILYLSYGMIKSTKGSMTKGMDPNTPNEMSKTRIKKLSEKLKNGTYEFPNVRISWILKPGKNIKWNKTNFIKLGRPFGMSDFEAKLVQHTLYLVLNAIYEPIFEKIKKSYGFREGLSCPNCIIQLRPQTQGMDIVIKGDMKSALNDLDHNILIKKIRRYTNDKKFQKLIYNCCKSGIFDELQNSTIDLLSGVPQGGIVSHLLWNIYMHDFDQFICNEIQQTFNHINKGQKRYPTNFSPNSKIYKSRLYYRTTIRKKLEKLKNYREIKNLPPYKKELAVQLKIKLNYYNKLLLKTVSKNKRKIKLRFYYTRYADNWVFFTNAKQILAQLIKNKIKAYLKDYLKLSLSEEKTKITNLYKNRVKFLGYSIHKLRHKKISLTKFSISKRTKSHKLNIGIDKDRVIDKFTWMGYLDKKKRPRELPAISTLDNISIIRKFNLTIDGYINYYAPVIDQKTDLNYFIYILEYSCYKTLCQKYRTTIHKLLKLHGTPLHMTENTNSNNETTEKSITLITLKTCWKLTDERIKRMRNNLIKNQ